MAINEENWAVRDLALARGRLRELIATAEGSAHVGGAAETTLSIDDLYLLQAVIGAEDATGSAVEIVLRELHGDPRFHVDERGTLTGSHACPNCGDTSNRLCPRCSRFGAHGGVCRHVDPA